MPDESNNIYLYEALELRSEYESRLNTLKELLPESQNGDSSLWRGNHNDRKYVPIEELDMEELREKIKNLELKKRKLNNAIQKTNFETYINFQGKEINLTEALDLRKVVNEDIANLSKKLKKSAYKKIIYKEDRDIVEKPELYYKKVKNELEKKRIEFRNLNRKLRKISLKTVVDYKDEKEKTI